MTLSIVSANPDTKAARIKFAFDLRGAHPDLHGHVTGQIVGGLAAAVFLIDRHGQRDVESPLHIQYAFLLGFPLVQLVAHLGIAIAFAARIPIGDLHPIPVLEVSESHVEDFHSLA